MTASSPSHLIRRTDAILVASARPDLDRAAESVLIELSAGEVDWTDLVESALRHQVTPALFRTFSHSAVRPGVPTDLFEAMQQYCDSARERNACLAAEVRRLVVAMVAEHLPAIPFKGAVLAQMLYDDLGQRTAGDIDLHVRASDVPRVRALLESHGYRDLNATSIPMTVVQHRLYQRGQCEYQFIRDADHIIVEPHWAFAQHWLSVSIDYPAMFDRARRATLWNASIAVHAPEDLLLALCIHGGKHEWERLSWIRDIAALLARKGELDIELAVSRARDQHCARLLLLGVHLAHRMLDAPLSASVREAIRRDPAVDALTAHCMHRLFDRARPPVENLWPTHFAWQVHDDVASRVRYLRRLLLEPRRRHIEAIRLPGALAWLYYPLRWTYDYALRPVWLLVRS